MVQSNTSRAGPALLWVVWSAMKTEPVIVTIKFSEILNHQQHANSTVSLDLSVIHVLLHSVIITSQIVYPILRGDNYYHHVNFTVTTYIMY